MRHEMRQGEEPPAPTYTPAEIFAHLSREAAARGINAQMYTETAEMRDKWLHLRVHVVGAVDAYDVATQLQDLEDSWNDQEPRRFPRLTLMPTGRARDAAGVPVYPQPVGS